VRAIRELLRDRKRSQQGSVLSGVLIMTAFIAIIAGALLTELSTNFLLSRSLVNRVAFEATDSSAIELSLSSLQSAPLNAPCPSLAPATVNNLTASASYLSCWPTVDVRSLQFRKIGSSSGAFNLDGVHVQLGGLNDYVVGDAAGDVFDYRFDTAAQRWNLDLDGATTAPPLVLQRPGYSGQYLDVIPLSGGPSCPTSAPCLNVRIDNGTFTAPPQQCLIVTSSGAAVTTRPAASPSIGGLVYFADGANLEANDVSAAGAGCSPKSITTISGSMPVVADPVAFPCVGGCGQTIDYIYAVVSDGTSSRLVEYTYDSRNGFESVGSWALPWANPRGIAVQSVNLPAGLAITFAGGGVALYTLRSSGPSLLKSQVVGGGIADAPYWCGPCSLFGVAAQNGGLYLFDSSLNPVAAYTGTGSAINTTPGVDGAGNWYFAADDGYLHEVQIQGGQLVQVKEYGGMGTIGSSVQVGGCGAGICVFLGTTGNAIYLVPLDARDAVLSACIASAPTTCSGANPRLWASVEVGDANSAQTVHVEGWSYYSG
jgi:hypothetical protein